MVELNDREGRLWSSTPSGVVVLDVSPPVRRSGTGTARLLPFTAASASGSRDLFTMGDARGGITVLEPSNNRYRRWRIGNGEAIVSLCFTGRGKELAISMERGGVVVVNVATSNIAARLTHARPGHSSRSVVHVTTDPKDGTHLCTFSAERVVLWRATGASWEQVQCLVGGTAEGPHPAGRFVAARLFGGLVAVLCDDDRLLGWSLASLELKFELTPGERAGLACFAAGDVPFVVAGGRNGMLYFWDGRDGGLTQVVEMPPSVRRVVQLEVVESTNQVAVLGDDGRVLLLSTSADGSCAVDMDMRTFASPTKGLVGAFAVGSRYFVGLSPASGTLVDLQAAAAAAAEAAASVPMDPSLYTRLSKPGAASAHALKKCASAPHGSSRRAVAAGRKATDAPDARPKFALPLPASLAPGAGRPRLSRSQLCALIQEHGALPDKHRPMLWRFLLALPENTGAFKALLAKGPHPATSDVGVRYPLRDSRKLRRLSLVVGALAHWSPLAAELEYLPAVVFPFLLVFGNDDLAATEASVAVLTHWHRSFLCTFPHPPVPLLAALERCVGLHDPALLRHLVRVGAGPTVYGWPLLRSSLSEVLGRQAWLALWDHLFAWSDEPHSLLLAALALLLAHRTALLGLRSASEVAEWLHGDQCVDAHALLSHLRRLRAHHPTCVILRTASDRVSHDDDDDGGSGGCSSSARAFPLPASGPYPQLRGFPRFALTYQQEERARIAAAEEAAHAQRSMLEAAAARAREMEAAEEAWSSERRLRAEHEAERLAGLRKSHERSLLGLAAAESSRQRATLGLVFSAEAAAEGALQSSQLLSESLIADLDSELSFAREAAARSEALAEDSGAVADEVVRATLRLHALAANREAEDRARDFHAEVRGNGFPAPFPQLLILEKGFHTVASHFVCSWRDGERK